MKFKLFSKVQNTFGVYRFLKTNFLINVSDWFKISKLKNSFQILPAISITYWKATNYKDTCLVVSHQKLFNVSISWLCWIWNLTPIFLIVTDKFWCKYDNTSEQYYNEWNF